MKINYELLNEVIPADPWKCPGCGFEKRLILIQGAMQDHAPRCKYAETRKIIERQGAKRFHFFCFHEKLKFMGYPKSGPLKGKFIYGWRCPKCGKYKHNELWWRCGGFL